MYCSQLLFSVFVSEGEEHALAGLDAVQIETDFRQAKRDASEQ